MPKEALLCMSARLAQQLANDDGKVVPLGHGPHRWAWGRFAWVCGLGLLVSPGAMSAQITVSAESPWVSTGIDVKPGQRLVIDANGQWSNGGAEPQWVGPDGFAGLRLVDALDPTLPFAALIGRVGNHTFLVGASYRGVPTVDQQATGPLFLAMNDTKSGFADNHGSVKASVTVRPPIAADMGRRLHSPAQFMAAPQFIALVELALGSGRLQLSQTGAGSPRQVTRNGSMRSVMSYIAFGPFIAGQGLDALPIDLPELEYSPEQIQNTGGATILAQYIITHSFVFVDRVRFLLNNIHADFDTDLKVRLGDGEVLLDVALQAPDPAARGEGNGFTAAPFGIPIPLGWEDGLCPDITLKDMHAVIHLSPIVDAAGQIHLNNPVVELTGDLSLSVGDWLVKDVKARIRGEFEDQLNAQLATDAVKQPIESALTTLLLAGKPNAGVKSVLIDSNGLEVSFRP